MEGGLEGTRALKNHGALRCICSHCFVHAVFSSVLSSRSFLQLPCPVSAVCEL